MNNSNSSRFSLGIKTSKNNSNNNGFGLFNDNKPKKKQGFFI